MPAGRRKATFEPIAPDFDVGTLVESNKNFQYVDRVACDMIDHHGIDVFDTLVLLHVVIGGKPLVIDGYHDRLDPWTFSPKWLVDNHGEKVENVRDLTRKTTIPFSICRYMNNMDKLADQFFENGENYKDTESRQRMYLKDIDCPQVWQDKLKEHLPSNLFYLNESKGDIGGAGAVDEPAPMGGCRKGRGIAPAGDLMSSLPQPMRAKNLMCYIGHEGTYTPAHHEMCASLGCNIMVSASDQVGDGGKPEQPGSSIWFMTESKDRHTVQEYWLSTLGHDIEVEKHFAQIAAWEQAPFTTYVVEQRPGDMILIPPLAAHQVWNRGTRTIKVAWNRTTVETLELAIKEALPNARMVCRDEQYKNKALVYYTLQKYSSLLMKARNQLQTAAIPEEAMLMLKSEKIRQVQKDFKRLLYLFRDILLSESFSPDLPAERNLEFIPFDSNITCAYCRGNIFNRFLSCSSCEYALDGEEPEPYDICMECYAMGRSCGCITKFRWVEQFKWKNLAHEYELWRTQFLDLESLWKEALRKEALRREALRKEAPGKETSEKEIPGKQASEKEIPGKQASEKEAPGKKAPWKEAPLSLNKARQNLKTKTLAHVCQEQLKLRLKIDVENFLERESPEDEESNDNETRTIGDGTVKKPKKRLSEAFSRNKWSCHVCCHRHERWKMVECQCGHRWCYGTLFRGFDQMPAAIMEDPDWRCPHCQGICISGQCKHDQRQKPYQPKGTVLGHDTRLVADERSVEILVNFSVSNISWLKESIKEIPDENARLDLRRREAERAKAHSPSLEVDHYATDEDDLERWSVNGTGHETVVDPALEPTHSAVIDPALTGDWPDFVASTAVVYRPPMTDLGGLDDDKTHDDNTYDDQAAEGNLRKRDADSLDMAESFKRQPIEKRQRRSDDNDNDAEISGASKQFRKKQKRNAPEKARKNDRCVTANAAIKDPLRITRLQLAPTLLANALQDNHDSENNILLQSDIQPVDQAAPIRVPTKSKSNKPVRIIVEQDEDSGARRYRKTGRLDSQGKQISKGYEEVEIASSLSDISADVPASTNYSASSGGKGRERRISAWQAQQHPDDDGGHDELPDNWKDVSARRRRPHERAPARSLSRRHKPSSERTADSSHSLAGKTFQGNPSVPGRNPRRPVRDVSSDSSNDDNGDDDNDSSAKHDVDDDNESSAAHSVDDEDLNRSAKLSAAELVKGSASHTTMYSLPSHGWNVLNDHPHGREKADAVIRAAQKKSLHSQLG